MPSSRQFIYQPVAAGPREFIEFWAPRYGFANEIDYTHNIRGPHTNESLRTMFRWKMGTQFQNAEKLAERERHFISRTEEARGFAADVTAADFLASFANGGRIARIFWLHCWYPDRFPIYDQHVHRAMVFIQEGRIEELAMFTDKAAIDAYLTRYLPFHGEYKRLDLPFDVKRDGVRHRNIDRALWTFGKCLLNASMPPLDRPFEL